MVVTLQNHSGNAAKAQYKWSARYCQAPPQVGSIASNAPSGALALGDINVYMSIYIAKMACNCYVQYSTASWQQNNNT